MIFSFNGSATGPSHRLRRPAWFEDGGDLLTGVTADTTRSTVLMVGLAASGKTTYVSAAWYALRNPIGKAELQLVQLPEDIEFWNGLMENWLACEIAPHTRMGPVSDQPLRLSRRHGDPVDFAIPDYSGEF